MVITNLYSRVNIPVEKAGVFPFLNRIPVMKLSEINFKLMVEKQVVNPVESIKINKMENTDQLEVTGFIHTLQYPEESIEIEIKAVTYHQVNIVEENGIYRTKIFFDI